MTPTLATRSWLHRSCYSPQATWVVATTSPRSADVVRAAGADEIIDRTKTDILGAVTESVGLLLNLAPIGPDEVTALVRLVRDGGGVVSTTALMATLEVTRRTPLTELPTPHSEAAEGPISGKVIVSREAAAEPRPRALSEQRAIILRSLAGNRKRRAV